MRAVLFAVALTWNAAPAFGSEPTNQFADPRGNVEIRFIRSEGGLSEYELRNRSSSPILYYHWAGQGPEPAAYCKKSDSSLYLCSEMVYVEGDDASGYTEWIHETVLQPMTTVTFKVRSPSPVSIGVKFPLPAQSGDVTIWTDEQ